jgi:hypothetical protein
VKSLLSSWQRLPPFESLTQFPPDTACLFQIRLCLLFPASKVLSQGPEPTQSLFALFKQLLSGQIQFSTLFHVEMPPLPLQNTHVIRAIADIVWLTTNTSLNLDLHFLCFSPTTA